MKRKTLKQLPCALPIKVTKTVDNIIVSETPSVPAMMDDSDESSYDCTVSNRFDILKIPMDTIPAVLIKRKDPPPPPIIIMDSRANVEKHLKPNKGFALVNLRNGTKVLPTNAEQHKAMITLMAGRIKFYSFGPSESKLKRFVLYGLNTHDLADIQKDLEQYGIKPERITPMRVRKARYADHQTYLVYYKHDSPINLATVTQAKYILNTKVSWANYKINGDGTPVCGRCSNYGHSANYCNLDPRCGVCAGQHTPTNCQLIQAKHAAGSKKNPREPPQMRKLRWKSHGKVQ